MMSIADRVGGALRISHRAALLMILAGLAAIVVMAVLATRQDRLPIVVALAFMVFALLLSYRWPMIALLAFAALIPIEEAVVISGLGTLSRVAGVLFAAAYGVPRLRHLKLGAMPAAGWAYLVWAVASLAWAISPDTTWGQLSTLIQLFIIAVLIADFVVERPSIVRPILWAYSMSAAAAALIGIVSYLALGITGTRATAVQDQDPAQFAGVLLPGLVFGVHEVLNGNRRALGGVIAVLTTVGVVVSGTRGAWVAAVLAMLLILLRLRPWRRVGAIVAIVAVIAIAYQVPGVADLVAQRTGNAISTGGAGRTDIWSVGLTIYTSAPVLGVGFANFPVAFTPDAVQMANPARAMDVFGRGPHNLAIGTLAELGPMGMLLLALFLGPLVLRRGWGPEARIIQTTLASLLVTALFLDIFSNRKQVWLVIALAAGLGYLARHEPRVAVSADPPPDTLVQDPWGSRVTESLTVGNGARTSRQRTPSRPTRSHPALNDGAGKPGDGN